jgi:cytochrome P450
MFYFRGMSQQAQHGSGDRAIPGPHAWPIVGNGLSVLRHGIFPVLERSWRTHGDTFRITLGPKRMVVIVHPDDVEKVLISERDKFFKGASYDFFRVLVGDGMVTNEGEKWRVRRRVAQPSFNKGTVAALAGKMTAATETMLASWAPKLQVGTEFDIYEELLALTMWIIGDTLFSLDLRGAIDRSAEAFTVALDELSARGNEMLRVPMSWPTPGNRRLKQALQTLDDTVYGIVRGRRASGERPDDLLSALLAGHDEHGRPLDDKALRDEVITFFLAGHETTALALSWTWFMLATHPDIQDKLVAEVDEVLAGRTPTADDLQRMPYTRMVLQEALRLYAPTWSGARDVVAPAQLGGYEVAPGDIVMYLPYFTHRHHEFWDAPEEVRPERFAPEAVQGRHKGAYLPFSAGPRMCIGNHFSLMEGALILAMICQRYRFSLSPRARIEPQFQITMRPKYGVLLRVDARR